MTLFCKSNKKKRAHIGWRVKMWIVFSVKEGNKTIYEQANDMMQTDYEYIGELYDYFDAAFLKLFLKNGAICERDEFETKVKQIGMRWYSV